MAEDFGRFTENSLCIRIHVKMINMFWYSNIKAFMKIHILLHSTDYVPDGGTYKFRNGAWILN